MLEPLRLHRRAVQPLQRRLVPLQPLLLPVQRGPILLQPPLLHRELPLLGGDLPGQLLELAVLGQPALQLGGLGPQPGDLILAGHRRRQLPGGGFQLRLQPFEAFPGRLQALPVLFPDLPLLDLGDQLLQLPTVCLPPPVQLPLAKAVLRQNPVQQGDQLPAGQITPAGLLRRLPVPAVPGALDGGPVPADVLRQGVALPLQLPRGLLQPVLNGLVQPGAKKLPENGPPVIRPRLQQLPELPLGDHGHLDKLLEGQAQQLLHRFGGPVLFGRAPLSGQHTPVRAVELRALLLGGGSASPHLGPIVPGVPTNPVVLAPAAEGQLHKGRRLRQGVLAAQQLRPHVFPAGLAKEGEGDGVEDGGLARPGVAADHIQPLPAQLVQVQLHLPRVGAEGGDGQFCGSHARSSCICSTSSAR